MSREQESYPQLFAPPFALGYVSMEDSHSKWLEVEPMTTITTEKTIEVLRRLFARFGLPKQLMSNNGPQFTSTKFAAFTPPMGRQNGLYKPSSRH